MPARSGASLNQTAPMNQQSPAARAPGAATPFGSAPPAAFGAGPPGAFGSAPPAFGQGPAPQTQAFGSAPPPAVQHHMQQQPQQQAFGSVPPGAYGGGPPAGASQPPIFGAYQSSPPEAPLDVNAMGQNFNPSTQVIPGSPGMPQNLGFSAPVLVDVTPRGLVVETAGGYADTIIPRNAKIPCERTRRFATGRDMQTVVRVRVGQGESTQFGQNTFLGEVELSGLRPAPRGEVTVAVTFEVDADGTLRIRARDVQTGQEARATLQLIGVADESSVVMMINRFAQQPVVGTETPRGPTH